MKQTYRFREQLYATLLALAITVLFMSAAFAKALKIKGFTLTVSDMDRSVAFFEQALGFSKTADRTFADRDHDDLTGVFGTRVRSVVLKLGDETIELEQYLSPAGQPAPAAILFRSPRPRPDITYLQPDRAKL